MKMVPNFKRVFTLNAYKPQGKHRTANEKKAEIYSIYTQLLLPANNQRPIN